MDSPTKGDEGEGQMSPPMKRFFHQVSSQSDNPTKITIKTRVMDDNNGHPDPSTSNTTPSHANSFSSQAAIAGMDSTHNAKRPSALIFIYSTFLKKKDTDWLATCDNREKTLSLFFCPWAKENLKAQFEQTRKFLTSQEI